MKTGLLKQFVGMLFVMIGFTSSAWAADNTVKIAFVDTGNTGRSVTSAALATAVINEKKLDAKVISRAINLDPYDIHPEANFVTLLKPRGLDTSAHIATQFGVQDAKFSTVILTMTEKHKNWVIANFPETKDKVFTLSEYATGQQGEVLDAWGQPMDFYKKVLAQLDGLVGAAVTKATAKK